MPAAKRPPAGQEALFEVTPIARDVQRGEWLNEALGVPRDPAGPGSRPWEPIDENDRQLGYQYPYVTPRRAYDIRQEIEHGNR